MLVPLRSQSLPAQAQAAVRAAIFAGELAPGDPLRELTLSRELGIGQAAVREALLALEHEGLVERLANRGTRVVNLTGAEVRDRLAVRLLLEEEACAAAAARLDMAGWDRLRAGLVGIKAAAAAGDQHRAAQADLAFHRLLWEAAGSPMLVQALAGVAVPLFAFVSILRARVGRMDDLGPMHLALLDVIATGKRPAVRASLRAHVLPAYQPFLDSGVADMAGLLRAG